MPELSYFDVLGLTLDAAQDEVEERYQALVAYLAAPELEASLGEWVSQQRRLAREAYAVLGSPARRRRYEGQLLGPAEASRDPGSRRAERRSRGGRETTPRRGFLEGREPLRLALTGLGLGVVVLLAFLLVRVFVMENRGSEGAPQGAQSAEPAVVVDVARVKQLEAIVQADPQNVSALLGLSDAYFQGEDWEGMLYWAKRARDVAPNNLDAVLDVGTASFNVGDYAGATEAWTKAAELYPDEPSVHYNLSFLYAFGKPQNKEAALREGDRVLQLAPDGELALAVHFDRGRMYLMQQPADVEAAFAEWRIVVAMAPNSELGQQVAELINVHGSVPAPTP